MQATMVFVGGVLAMAIAACHGSAPPAAPVQTAAPQMQPAAPPVQPAAAPVQAAAPSPDDDEPRTADQAIARMSEFRDDMCKCSTKRCADDVIAIMSQWGQRMAKAPGVERVTEADTKRMAEVVETMTACMTATLTAAAASTTATAVPGQPGEAQQVAPTALDAQRIAGNKNIVPDNDVKRALASSGKSKLVTSYKVCIDVAGLVSRVTVLESSGYASYDAKIEREIGAWRYRPFRVNGAAAPVCTAVTFIYSQMEAPPRPRPKP